MTELKLVPMTTEEYSPWYDAAYFNYKNEIQRMGMTESEAEKKTKEDFTRLLPMGIKTPDHYLFSLRVDEFIVGTIWFATRGPAENVKAYIYDIVLNENARGKGYGKKAMELVEVEVKKMGLRHIGLHVFGHNKVARNLYEKLGYVPISITMEKELL